MSLSFPHTAILKRGAAADVVATLALDVQDTAAGRGPMANEYPAQTAFLRSSIASATVQAGDRLTITRPDGVTVDAVVAGLNRTDDSLAVVATDATVYVQERTDVKGASGVVTSTWADVADAETPAALLTAPGEEALRADAVDVLQRVRVIMPFRADVRAAGAAGTLRLRTGGTSEAPTGVLGILSVAELGAPLTSSAGALDVITNRAEA